MKKTAISLVFPVYNESDCLPSLFEEIKKLQADFFQYDFEVIFGDDSSSDDSLELIRSSGLKNVKILRMDRNRGHQFVLSAALRISTGDYVATMDADLQHPFGILKTMINTIESTEHDAILTFQRKRIHGTVLKRTLSQIYWRMLFLKSKSDVIHNVGDFRIMRKSLVTKLNKYGNSKVLRFLIPELSSKLYYLPYVPDSRIAGESKYSWKKMLSLGINGYLQLTSRPLEVLARSGLVLLGSTFMYSIYVFVKFISGQNQPGWTSLVLLISFFGSTNLIGLATIGEYIGRLYDNQNLVSDPFEVEEI